MSLCVVHRLEVRYIADGFQAGRIGHHLGIQSNDGERDVESKGDDVMCFVQQRKVAVRHAELAASFDVRPC